MPVLPHARCKRSGFDLPLELAGAGFVSHDVTKFLLWCLLLVLCWPVAILALLIYPFVWLVLLPFRLLGIAVDGMLALLRAVVFFPVRVLAPRRW